MNGIEERLARLEERVKMGFEYINNLFNNHLATHDKREKFWQKVTVALISITGSAIVSLLILLVKFYFTKG